MPLDAPDERETTSPSEPCGAKRSQELVDVRGIHAEDLGAIAVGAELAGGDAPAQMAGDAPPQGGCGVVLGQVALTSRGAQQGAGVEPGRRQLREHSEWGPYLDARARLVTELADTVHQQAITTGRTPAWLASTLGQPTAQTIADLTVWRAAMGVPDADLRPTGELQFPKATARCNATSSVD